MYCQTQMRRMTMNKQSTNKGLRQKRCASGKIYFVVLESSLHTSAHQIRDSGRSVLCFGSGWREPSEIVKTGNLATVNQTVHQYSHHYHNYHGPLIWSTIQVILQVVGCLPQQVCPMNLAQIAHQSVCPSVCPFVRLFTTQSLRSSSSFGA